MFCCLEGRLLQGVVYYGKQGAAFHDVSWCFNVYKMQPLKTCPDVLKAYPTKLRLLVCFTVLKAGLNCYLFSTPQNQQHEIEVKIETQKSHRKHFESRLKELLLAIKKAEREHENMKKLARVSQPQFTAKNRIIIWCLICFNSKGSCRT